MSIQKPANFTRPFYKAFKDSMWYWRIKEGVPGTRMPRWERSLSDQQIAYLVAYLKTLPADGNVPAGQIEVTNYTQLDSPDSLSGNYNEIERLQELQHHSPYVYGGGRH